MCLFFGEFSKVVEFYFEVCIVILVTKEGKALLSSYIRQRIMRIYFTITNNCNLECPHCCYEAGPSKETMPLEDIKKIVDNFPKELLSLTLSGGEVFTVKKTLYSALDYIKEKHFPKLRSVSIQSNCFWATSKKRINKTLEELIEHGVTQFEFTSNTHFHKRAGLNIKYWDYLNDKILDKKLYRFRTYFNGLARAFPLGRAENLKKVDLLGCNPEHSKADCNFTPLGGQIKINYKGNIYPCCWMIPGTEMGDARTENLSNIFSRKAHESPVFKRLISSGIEGDGVIGVAKESGLSKKEIKKHLQYSSCNLCRHLFTEGIVKL